MATGAEIQVRATVKDQISKPLDRINTKMRDTAKAGKDLNGTMRLMRGGAGQLGHQVQDVAVQLQMGTDAMIVFGQQGSQVASLFGPKGAMIGGILAVGAALSRPFMDALTNSSDAIADLGEEAGKFNDITKEMIPLLKEIEQAGIDKKYKEIQEEIDDLIEESARYKAEIDGIRNGTIAAIATDTKRERQLSTLERLINENSAAIAVKTAAQRELNSVNDAAVLANREQAKSLQDQVKTYGMSETAIAEYNAMKDGEISKEEFAIITLTRRLETLKQATKDQEAADKAQEKANKLKDGAIAKQESLNQKFLEEHIRLSGGKVALDLYKASLLGLGQDSQAVALILANDAERTRLAEEKLEQQRQKAADAEAKRKATELARQKEQDKATALSMTNQFASMETGSKKMFRIQKAFGIAAATISTFEAVNNALALKLPPPIPQVMAGIALTTGLANVAQIKAQSFEGGGFTGHGARAGGLDGKGGRMAMVHPNETVIDHTKGAAGGITVINNVDARGSGADVDQKIKSAMAQTSQQTIMTIQDLMRRRRFV
jgi:hypothetical protein